MSCTLNTWVNKVRKVRYQRVLGVEALRRAQHSRS